MDVFNAEAATPEQCKEKILRVKRIYDSLDIPSDARAEILRYSDLAIEAVKDLPCDITPLREFSEKLIGRAK